MAGDPAAEGAIMTADMRNTQAPDAADERLEKTAHLQIRKQLTGCQTGGRGIS